ncbi:MAG: PepSY domain-containing protein [Rhizobiales bacterium]|nr:PepSY domain-containing protein [Hyphomicrobiales bacterium]
MTRSYVTRLAVIAIATTIAGAAPAAASDDDDCPRTSRAEWRSADDVKAALEAQGYSVVRVKVDDGCYEAYARDRQGARREVNVHPVTMEIISSEVDD